MIELVLLSYLYITNIDMNINSNYINTQNTKETQITINRIPPVALNLRRGFAILRNENYSLDYNSSSNGVYGNYPYKKSKSLIRCRSPA